MLDQLYQFQGLILIEDTNKIRFKEYCKNTTNFLKSFNASQGNKNNSENVVNGNIPISKSSIPYSFIGTYRECCLFRQALSIYAQWGLLQVPNLFDPFVAYNNSFLEKLNEFCD